MSGRQSRGVEPPPIDWPVPAPIVRTRTDVPKTRGNTMNRRSFMTAAAASAIAPAFIGRASAQTGLPYDAITALRTMGLGAQSQVMNTASYLLDVLGPRLS